MICWSDMGDTFRHITSIQAVRADSFAIDLLLGHTCVKLPTWGDRTRWLKFIFHSWIRRMSFSKFSHVIWLSWTKLWFQSRSPVVSICSFYSFYRREPKTMQSRWLIDLRLISGAAAYPWYVVDGLKYIISIIIVYSTSISSAWSRSSSRYSLTVRLQAKTWSTYGLSQQIVCCCWTIRIEQRVSTYLHIMNFKLLWIILAWII